MAVNIDYGLGARQAAIGGWVDAEKGRANAEAEAAARKRKKARQQRKGLMTAALHVGAGIATGGASIPYSMKYGDKANKALMGDDYEGSAMQSVQGLGSMVYAGAEQKKAKAINDKRTAFNNTQNSLYKALDGLPDTEKGQIAKQNISLQLVTASDAFEKDIMKMKQAPIWGLGETPREQLSLRNNTANVGQGGTSVQSVQSALEAENPYGTDKAGVATGTYVPPPPIPIGHDLADMSDEEEANNPYGAAQSFPMGPSSNKQQMAQRLETQSLSGGGYDRTKPNQEFTGNVNAGNPHGEDMLARKSDQGIMNLGLAPGALGTDPGGPLSKLYVSEDDARKWRGPGYWDAKGEWTGSRKRWR